MMKSKAQVYDPLIILAASRKSRTLWVEEEERELEDVTPHFDSPANSTRQKSFWKQSTELFRTEFVRAKKATFWCPSQLNCFAPIAACSGTYPQPFVRLSEETLFHILVHFFLSTTCFCLESVRSASAPNFPGEIDRPDLLPNSFLSDAPKTLPDATRPYVWSLRSNIQIFLH